MESPRCSSGSTRLSRGAPASPMHLVFHVRVSPSTLSSSSPPLEATLPSLPATRTRWQQHRRRCTWRTPPRTARFDRGSPHAPVKAAAAGSVLGHRHQAAATGSTPERRRWNVTVNAARVAIIEAVARKAGSLDRFEALRRCLSHLHFFCRRLRR
ncbi:hypothetical protein CK203_018532 [Vitis vinifera]|uniref:Uncharacterized protein n=1 Tax=Vitis vinifera TaxID=29760 RepID=A0A438J635_VITVI|nr:hypothetical protein CK203_018532 [Vitis vinifera]